MSNFDIQPTERVPDDSGRPEDGEIEADAIRSRATPALKLPPSDREQELELTRCWMSTSPRVASNVYFLASCRGE